MEKFIYMLLCGVVGGTLAVVDVNISSWYFWIILGCVCGSNICGYISGMKKYT